MSKKKISSADFLRLMEDEENSSQPIAFAPQSFSDNATKSLAENSTIDQETDNKEITLHEPKLSQNGNKSLDNHVTVSSSAPSKPLAKREQSVSNASPKAVATREQSVSKPLAESRLKKESVSNASPKAVATREQSVSKPLAESDVLGLIGKEKKLLFFIFQKCESVGSLETQIVTTEELLKSLDVSSVRLRNLIFRLQEEKCLIKVTQVHLGRSGWRKFSLDKEVFQIIRIHLSSEKALAEREQTVSNASPKALAYTLAEPSYSSSSNNLNINTNTIELPENLRRFGISVVNLQNLITSGKTTKEIVDNSLTALSFDIEHGKTGNIANILFGVLGTGREYISQKYSESLQEELELELERIRQAEENQKRSVEMKLVASFKEYLGQHPEFLDSVKDKHNGFVTSSELLEKVAFEEYKNLGVES